MTKAVIWGRKSDPKTFEIQRTCKSIGVETEIKDLLNAETLSEFKALLPEAKSVPQVYVDDAKVGSYAEFYKWSNRKQTTSERR